MTDLEHALYHHLAPTGLHPLGAFGLDGMTAFLIGNVGSSLWTAFSGSWEYRDGRPDPLDRWTMRVVESLVDSMPSAKVAEIRYPFGDRAWPFQDYGRRAMGVTSSPIGLLIHPKFGLWTAFRALLIIDRPFDKKPASPIKSPCHTCDSKPCLSTCPISAFTSSGYDYPSCKTYVASRQGRACLKEGCQARRACPVGSQFAYSQVQQAFHMRAFV